MMIRPLSIRYRADVGFDGGLGIVAAQTCLSVQPHSKRLPDSRQETIVRFSRVKSINVSLTRGLQHARLSRDRTDHAHELSILYMIVDELRNL